MGHDAAQEVGEAHPRLVDHAKGPWGNEPPKAKQEAEAENRSSEEISVVALPSPKDEGAENKEGSTQGEAKRSKLLLVWGIQIGRAHV